MLLEGRLRHQFGRRNSPHRTSFPEEQAGRKKGEGQDDEAVRDRPWLSLFLEHIILPLFMAEPCLPVVSLARGRLDEAWVSDANGQVTSSSILITIARKPRVAGRGQVQAMGSITLREFNCENVPAALTPDAGQEQCRCQRGAAQLSFPVLKYVPIKLLPQRSRPGLSPKPIGFNPNVSPSWSRFAVFCTQILQASSALPLGLSLPSVCRN